MDLALSAGPDVTSVATALVEAASSNYYIGVGGD